MTVVLMDSFDHFSSPAEKLWSSNPYGNGSPTISASAARTGGQGLYNASNIRPGTTKFFGGSATTGVIGVAYRQLGMYYAGICGPQASAYGAPHIWLTCDSLGRLVVYRYTGGSPGSSLGTSAAVMAANTWAYLEMAFTIHDTTGGFQVWVNGVSVLTVTNVDTSVHASNVFDTVMLGSWTDQTGNGTQSWDDLMVQSGTTTPLGDLKVECQMPNGNGNSSQLVGSDSNSTDNYLLVDETIRDTADYVESSTPGDKDTYAYANLATTAGTVHAVQLNPYAAKTDAGTRTIATVARLSGTEVDGPTVGLSTSYQYLSDIRETKPGGGAWTISDVNSAEFGVKVVA